MAAPPLFIKSELQDRELRTYAVVRDLATARREDAGPENGASRQTSDGDAHRLNQQLTTTPPQQHE